LLPYFFLGLFNNAVSTTWIVEHQIRNQMIR